jgi:hypothetical protein
MTAHAGASLPTRGDVSTNKWTDEEINTLVRMWPNATIMQIANTLHRSYWATRDRAKLLREKGLLKAKGMPRNPSIRPDPRVDKAKMDYCSKHHISIADLDVSLERNGQLAAELYRLAEAAKLARLSLRHAAFPETAPQIADGR